MLNAVLALNKQPGQTSFDCVREVRRIYAERRVGHAGTLDPTARGLLPLCLGRATRLVDYFHLQSKRYLCMVHLGERSNTLDTEGTITPGGDASEIDERRVAEALTRFVGEITQIPPMHSAVRYEGQHLYQLARRGEEVERHARPAVIHSARLVGFRPGRVAEADLEVECGKGAFMRVLAADLGEVLGVGGMLAWLERTQYGALTLSASHTLDELRGMDDPTTALLSAEVAVAFLPRVDLAPPLVSQVRRGQPVFLPRPSQGLPQGEVRVHSADGELVALGEVTGGRFRPTKVLVS
jgi:tRNA pseudouridine55 synthase